MPTDLEQSTESWSVQPTSMATTAAPRVSHSQSLLDVLRGRNSLGSNTPPTQIYFTFTLLDVMRVRSKRNEVELSALVRLDWTDENLAWDPSLYDNVTQKTVSSSEVWTPDVTPFSLTQPAQTLSPSLVVVSYSGQVTQVNHLRMFVKCDVRASTTCSVHFGSWTRSEGSMQLHPSPAVVLDNFYAESMYKVVSSSMKKDVKFYTSSPDPYGRVDVQVTFKAKKGFKNKRGKDGDDDSDD